MIQHGFIDRKAELQTVAAICEATPLVDNSE
jgi:hypothetical protein